MLYLGIFGLDFEKVIAIFEISVLEFALWQNVVQKRKSLKLTPKMSGLRLLGMEFESLIVKFEINVLKFILLQSLVQKQTSLNLRPKMLYLGIFGLKFENNIVKESAPLNLSDCKILRKKNV